MPVMCWKDEENAAMGCGNGTDVTKPWHDSVSDVTVASAQKSPQGSQRRHFLDQCP
jgi:hypothetical protein